jgi:hypothetical protein
VIIRVASDGDWPRIWPFFSRIVAAGETYAYPYALTLETAEPLWMEESPGQTVVAIQGDTVLGSAKMGPNRNAVVETNTVAVGLWQSLAFEILATVPEAFDHPRHGLVGLHLKHQRL